jgi:hypothetical protein
MPTVASRFRRRCRNPARDGDEGRYGKDEEEESPVGPFLLSSSAAAAAAAASAAVAAEALPRVRGNRPKGTPAAVVSGGRGGRGATGRPFPVRRVVNSAGRRAAAYWLADKRERERERVGEQRPAATRRLWRARLGAHTGSERQVVVGARGRTSGGASWRPPQGGFGPPPP